MAQVTQSPGTMANDTSVGTVAWSNPNNAKVSDGVYAEFFSFSLVTSHYLKATNFGFSIPTGATINGILVEIQKNAAGLGISFSDNQVKIVKSNGSIGSTNKAAVGTWSSSNIYKSYGSSSDSWGETFTAEDINNSNFGVVISASRVESSNTIANIDHIRITVYYTEPTPYDFYLWSSTTLPWQLALPWKFLNGWQVVGAVTNYLISGVNSILTRLINLLASVTAYTISGVNINLIWESSKVLVAEVANYTITTVNSIFSWGRTLFSSVTNYTITGINSILTLCRCLITNATSYAITTVNANLLRPIINLISSVGEYVISSTGIGLYKGWGMLVESASYLISGVNVNLTRLINLLTSVTAYTITGIDVIIQRIITLYGSVTEYLITGVDVNFIKALNIILEVTAYTITGINTTFSRLRNLISSVAEYTITGINVNLLRPIRNLAVNTTVYTITTFSVIFRGIGDWLWKWTSKPSASDWTNGSKPTNTYNNDTKPSSNWVNDDKF